MAWNNIKALLTKLTDPNDKHTDDWVTGTDIGTTKRALDVSDGNNNLIILADHLLKGTEPSNNFDRIYKTVTDVATQTLTYVFDGAIQFYIDGTTLDSTPNVQFRSTNNLTLETGIDALLLESGDYLLKELE